jgi:hypothetical protein
MERNGCLFSRRHVYQKPTSLWLAVIVDERIGDLTSIVRIS